MGAKIQSLDVWNKTFIITTGNIDQNDVSTYLKQLEGNAPNDLRRALFNSILPDLILKQVICKQGQLISYLSH